MFSRFSHIVAWISISFLFIDNILWYRYFTSCLFIPQLEDMWFSPTFLLLWITLLWIYMYNSLCKYIFPSLLGIYPEMLSHMIIPSLVFWGTERLYAKQASPFCNPTSSTSSPQFSYMLWDTVWVHFTVCTFRSIICWKGHSFSVWFSWYSCKKSINRKWINFFLDSKICAN